MKPPEGYKEFDKCPKCGYKLHLVSRHCGIETTQCFHCGAKFQQVYDEEEFGKESPFVLLVNQGGV